MVKRNMRNKVFKTLLAASLLVAQIPTSFMAVYASNENTTTNFTQAEREHSSRTTLQEGALDNLRPLVTDEQLAALQNVTLERGNSGLVGFTDDYALPDDNSLVSVIVMFENNPAPVQRFEALLEGDYLSEAEAEANVESDHELFRQELSQLIGNQRTRNLNYQIAREYRVALNGVSLTVPANLLTEISEFESVRVIYPNVTVQAEPIDVIALTDALRNPAGMQPGRSMMQADELHAQGYAGEGIVVAVLDTGIDYDHPAFAGAFLTLEEAQLRNPELTEADAIQGYFFGRNLIDDVYMLPGLLNPEAIRPANDPMETTHEFWLGSGFPRQIPSGHIFYTSHGTHVAGTILGRDTGHENSILGVAPEARMIAYRVLGAYGMGTMASIVYGIELAYLDGADILNLSLGGADNTPAGWPTTVAVNNIKLANPYVVFVIAAGNSGSNLYTLSAPAVASTAITVANIVEAGYVGVTLDLDGQQAQVAFGSTPENWLAFNEALNLVSTTSDRLVADESGAYRIFGMPRTDFTNFYPGPVPGVGNADDFALLVELYGAEALQGAFVLVRRGYAFVEVASAAYELGIGGVIVINNTDANDASGIPSFGLPYVFVGLNEGIELYEALYGSDSPARISFLELYALPFRLSSTSSRGPVFQSFEIKPDLGANGTNVLSAIPSWFAAPSGGNDYTVAYGFASGTSMAAPHVAGAVALMIEYSRENARQWTSDEIKVRLMNTATPFENANYSVFEKGTGYANVLAAIQADVLVIVLYDRVAPELGTPFRYQPFAVTGTGSFSFGGQNITEEALNFERSLTAFIANESSTDRTFTISHSYNYGMRETRSPYYMDLSLSQSRITVPAGSEAEFTATLRLLETAPAGKFEGHLYVTDEANGNLVARLPFAAVRYEVSALFSGLYLYRPVVSTGSDRVNEVSMAMGLMVTPYAGMGFNTWIVQYAEGINETNWRTPDFIDNVLGLASQSILHEDGLLDGETYRGRVFDGWYIPMNGEELVPFQGEEGTYFLGLEIFRQIGTDEWEREQDVLLPFAIDNTPPVIVIDDLEEVTTETGEVVQVFNVESTDPIIVTGNVHDLWMQEAAEHGVTFDIWLENAQVDNDFLAVWVNIGRNSSFKVEVDAHGNFEIPLGNIHEALPVEIRVTAIDNWSVVPEIDAFLGTQNLRSYIGSGNWFFDPEGGLVHADVELHDQLHQGIIWGFWPDPLFDYHTWSGLNMAEFTFVVDGDLEPIQRDPNRPSAVFHYNLETPNRFTEMSSVPFGTYRPMDYIVVDFGRIFEEIGRVGDDAVVSFLWEHESTNLMHFGREGQSLRSMGVNPYDSATHLYIMTEPSEMHPLNLIATTMDWNNEYIFSGMEALRWLDGYWTMTIGLSWDDREAGADYFGISQVVRTYSTRSENPQRVYIDHLPDGGALWNEADFPAEILIGFDPHFYEFNFTPQVEYDQIKFAFLPDSFNPFLLVNIFEDGFVYLDWLPGYTFPLHLHLPDMDAHWRSNSMFEQPYRLHAWTQVDGVWQFADVSPPIQFRSVATIDIPIEDLIQLIEFIEAENLVEEDWNIFSWMYFQSALEQAKAVVAIYEAEGYVAQTYIIYAYRRLGTAFHQMTPREFDSNRLIALVDEITHLQLDEGDFTPETWEPFQWIYEVSIEFLYHYTRDPGAGWFTASLSPLNSPPRPSSPWEGGTVVDYVITEVYYYLRYRFEGLELINQGGESTHPIWEATTAFEAGSRVVYDGRVFEAQWWTQNQRPNESPWGAWMEIGERVSTYYGYADVWTASRIFDTGDLVLHNGYVFRANWWTRNQSPEVPHGPWEKVSERPMN